MSTPGQSSNRPSVVALLYPGCISYDVSLIAELVSRQYAVQTATSTGGSLTEGTGLPLLVHAAFSEIDLNTCQALLVPGGDATAAVSDKKLTSLIQTAHARGIFILAIGDAEKILRAAGLKFPNLNNLAEIYTVEDTIIVARAEGSIDAAIELSARLGVTDARFVTRTKDHYRGLLGRKIRALALALIKDADGRYLLHKMFDNKLKQVFYRPVGGGVDFHEPARLSIAREIREELGYEISVDELVQTFENIFVIEDLKGHEMVSVFRARFKDQSAYDFDELEIFESGKSVAKAVWKTPAEIKAEGSALYPVGIEALLK